MQYQNKCSTSKDGLGEPEQMLTKMDGYRLIRPHLGFRSLISNENHANRFWEITGYTVIWFQSWNKNRCGSATNDLLQMMVIN